VVFNGKSGNFIKVEVKSGGATPSANQTATDASIAKGELQEMRSAGTQTNGQLEPGDEFNYESGVTFKADAKTGEISVMSKSINPKIKGAQADLDEFINYMLNPKNQQLANQALNATTSQIPAEDLTPEMTPEEAETGVPDVPDPVDIDPIPVNPAPVEPIPVEPIPVEPIPIVP
jgi:hypothetical protein